MIVAELSFWSTVAVELFKAIFTALFVAGGAALVVSRFQSIAARQAVDHAHQREAADREREHERNVRARQRELEVELEKDRRALRTSFVTRVTESGGSFYFQTQRFLRQVGDPDVWGQPDPDALDEAYVSWAIRAESLEGDLRARFGWDSQPEILWHQVRDLLTVRYFDLRGRNTAGLRRKNCRTSDKLHSGLTESELEDRKAVLDAFHEAMRQLTDELLKAELAA